MNDQTKRYIIGGIVAVFGFICLAALLITLTFRISANDELTVKRLQEVQVACIQAGNRLIEGNCIYPGKS